MILFAAAAPPFMKNGFVLGCERTLEALVIDPGDEVAELLAFIHQRHLQPKAILLTHAHVDHVSGVGAAKADPGGARLAAPCRPAALRARRGTGRNVRPVGGATAAGGSLLWRGRALGTLWRFRGVRAPYARPLPRWRVPGSAARHRSLTPRGPVRRRHPLCRVHWPHRLARREPRDADAVHYGGAFHISR